MYRPFSVSHLVKHITPTQPFSFTGANFDTGTSVISTSHAATNEQFSHAYQPLPEVCAMSPEKGSIVAAPESADGS